MANFLDMSNKRASLSEISSHGVVAPSSSHGRPLVVEVDNGSEDGFERPTKKQSNVKTMARINLYSRIKVSHFLSILEHGTYIIFVF